MILFLGKEAFLYSLISDLRRKQDRILISIWGFLSLKTIKPERMHSLFSFMVFLLRNKKMEALSIEPEI
jgi:hypothetical protein